MIRLLLSALLLLLPAVTSAQQAPPELVQRGDEAARESRHEQAIDLYRQAIAADPALRAPLLPKLARQLLWSGAEAQATQLFREHLRSRPDDCEIRLDLALAFSWANDLADAIREYGRVREECPALRMEARLGEARALRWRNRLAEAGRAYAEVLARGTEPQRLQARIGTGLTALANGEPRRAMRLFEAMIAAGAMDPGVHEGRVQAALALGLPSRAAELLEAAERAEIRSPELDRLREELERARSPVVRPASHAFRDRDGTYRATAEIAASLGWTPDGRVSVTLQRSRLGNPGGTIEEVRVGASAERRFSSSLATVARLEVQRMEEAEFAPVTGEVDLIWTPGDRTRVDLATARLIISDNVAALRERLTGHFWGVGLDQGFLPRTSASGAVDLTRWSEGNTRVRVRAGVRHRFEGVPQITVGWPSVFQWYSEPFEFGLFSPERYLETGPEANVYRRVGSDWHLSAYGRAGAQSESGSPWSPLGTVRLAAERELGRSWGLRVDLSWTNSNLAGSSGFERRAVSVQLTGRP